MSDQPESPISNSDVTPPIGKNGKIGKAKSSPKVEYGTMRFRLPKGLERGVRYANLELEDNPKAIHKTPQAIVEEGVRRYLAFLSKHINFPPGMLPHNSTPE